MARSRGMGESGARVQENQLFLVQRNPATFTKEIDMVAKPVLTVLASVSLGLLAMAARANDTELPYGGSPRPLAGHPSVSMKSEYVRIEVGDKEITVDCRFTFHNKGQACQVRVGFPDEGADPGEDPDAKPRPPAGTFTTFKSWADGKPVKTTVIRAEEPGSVWHVKQIRFPARRTLKVRNRYTVPVGSSVAFDPVGAHLAKYVLHTGSSWHGSLGRSEIEVVFKRKGVGSPISLRKIREQGGRANIATDTRIGKRTVYYSGPCKPMVLGRTLRFVRTSWRPTPKDDILLVFDITRLRPAP